MIAVMMAYFLRITRHCKCL